MRRRVLVLASLILVALCLGGAIYAITRPLALNTALGYLVAYAQFEPEACQSEGLVMDGTYRAYSVQALPDGFMLYYVVDCSVPGQPTRTWQARHKFVVTGWHWTGASVERQSSALPPPPGTFAAYTTNVGYTEGRLYSDVSGRVFTNTVTAVVVVFANGAVEQSAPSDGYFAALTTPGVMACSLELLDAQGNVVQRYDLALPPPVPASFGTCPP